MIHWFQIRMLAVVWFGAIGLSTPSLAISLKQVGDQLFISGPIEVGDEVKAQDALAENPAIRTVILRNSPGGDVRTAYAIGNMMRAKRMRTAVSGYCNSGCSRLFLGGTERLFTDDYPPHLTPLLHAGAAEGPTQSPAGRESRFEELDHRTLRRQSRSGIGGTVDQYPGE